MKQTAVEWYENEINALLDKYENKEISEREFLTMKHNLFYPAKEMEKEQTIDFAKTCLNKAKDLDVLTAFLNVDKYYNETLSDKSKEREMLRVSIMKQVSELTDNEIISLYDDLSGFFKTEEK